MWPQLRNVVLMIGLAAAAHTNDTRSYRTSRPSPRNATTRVPSGLQDVRPQGFSYDDADDVIHIIEPPQQFQQLKRRLNQQGGGQAMVWEQQSKVRISRPQAGKPPSTVVMNATRLERPTRRMPNPMAHMKTMSVQSQPHQRQPMQKQVVQPQPNRPAPNRGKTRFAGDLLTQETADEPDVVAPEFPLEILASVRKTARLKQKHRANGSPPIRQRKKTKKIQTVILEKGFERKNREKINAQRLGGEKSRYKTKAGRSKRDVIHLSGSQPSQASHKTKREVSKLNAAKAQQIAATSSIERGNKLVQHIAELLRNTSFYLKDDVEERSDDTTSLRPESTSKTRDFKLPPALPQSKSRTASKTTPASYKKLVIAPTKDDGHRFGVRTRVKDFSSNFRTTTPEYASRSSKRQRNAKRGSSNFKKSTNGTRLDEQKGARAVNISASLLYADVMTNIRNMLHFTQTEKPLNVVSTVPSIESRLDTSLFLTPAKAFTAEATHVQELKSYLDEVQRVVTQLPANVSSKAATGLDQLAADWFLINSNGKIFPAPLGKQLNTTAAIFHRFPDIPNAKDFLRQSAEQTTNVLNVN